MPPMSRATGWAALATLSCLWAGVTGCASVPGTSPPSPGASKVEVRVDGGRVLDLGGASLVGGEDLLPAQEPVPPPPDLGLPGQPPQRQEEQDLLYLKFGPNIFVDKATGKISKLYTVPLQQGTVIIDMMKPAQGESPPGLLRRVLGEHEVIVELSDKLDQFLRGAIGYGSAPTLGALSDVLVVTSTADGLEAFERAYNFLFTSAPQIDITVRVVETSYSETLDIGVKQAGTSPTIQRLGSNPERMFIQSFAANFPNEAGLGAANSSLISEGLFTIGGIHDNWELKAILEALQSQVRADIVSQPRIAVRNGAVAEIATTSQVPYPKAKIAGQNIATDIAFQKVGVTMKIRPSISGTDTVLLQLDIQVDAVTGYENTEPVRTPVVSTRMAKTDVQVRNGQSVAIGGLLTQTESEVEKKVPVLGDIPVVGLLFRSTTKESRKSEVIFFVTPRIMRKGGAESFEQLIPMGGLGG